MGQRLMSPLTSFAYVPHRASISRFIETTQAAACRRSQGRWPLICACAQSLRRRLRGEAPRAVLGFSEWSCTALGLPAAPWEAFPADQSVRFPGARGGPERVGAGPPPPVIPPQPGTERTGRTFWVLLELGRRQQGARLEVCECW